MNTEVLKNNIVDILNDSKASDILAIDVSDKTTFTHYIIIATGTSDRHISSTIEHIRKYLKEIEFKFVRTEGRTTNWNVLDLGDIIVNVLDEESRQIYKLEDMWCNK